MFYNRQKIIYLIIAVLLIGGGVLSWAIFSGKIKIGADEPKPSFPAMTEAEYAPGEFIIKLKPSVGVMAKDSLGISGVQSVEPVFKPQLATASVEAKSQPADVELNRYLKIKVDLGISPEIKTESVKENGQIVDRTRATVKEKEMGARQAILHKLSTNPNIESVTPNFKRQALWAPNDPFFQHGTLWGITNIDAMKAWDLSKGDGVVVAVTDTGVDTTHPDLADNILKDQLGNIIGYNFIDNNSDVTDRKGHGTHVSGTIAAVGDNNLGVVGVAPKAKIMPVKGLDDTGSGYDSSLAGSIKFAVDHGAKVINMSWGGIGESPLIESTLEYAHKKGAVLVAAAGNSSMEAVLFFPANSKYVITVSAYGNSYQYGPASFTNFGPKVDVAAPGVDILSTVPGLYWNSYSGTSMATPHVSGLAALILAKNPTWNPDQVKNDIKYTASNPSEIFGYGKINAGAAVTNSTPFEAPIASINVPDKKLGGQYVVKGTAKGNGFASYKVYYRKYGKKYNNVLEIPDWIEAASGTQPVDNNTLGTIKLPDDGKYYLKLVVSNNAGLQSTAIDTSFYFNGINTLPGFPIYSPWISWYSYPVATKLDGSNQVLVTTTDATVDVYDSVGKLIWSKFVDVELPYGVTPPIISDINGDNKKEIIVIGNSAAAHPNDKVYAFDYQGNQLWSYDLAGESGQDVLLSDNLNNDGKNEIIVRSLSLESYPVNKTNSYKIIALDGDGKLVKESTLFENLVGIVDCSGGAAIGDLNNDGNKELALGCRNDFKELSDGWYNKADSYVMLLDNNLKTLWKKKIATDSYHAYGGGLVLADTNNDKQLEIIKATANLSTQMVPAENQILIYNIKGEPLKKIPIGQTLFWAEDFVVVKENSQISFIYAGSKYNKSTGENDTTVNRINLEGKRIGNWPFVSKQNEYLYINSLLVANINNTSGLEVVGVSGKMTSRDDRGIRILNNGKVVNSFFPQAEGGRGSLGDLNGDGKLEYYQNATEDGTYADYPGIYAYKFSGGNEINNLQWVLPHHDLKRTNNLNTPVN